MFQIINIHTGHTIRWTRSFMRAIIIARDLGPHAAPICAMVELRPWTTF